MKIREIIDRLEKFHHPVDPEHTCDVFKCGDPDAECTGIAVTCFASIDIIKKAAERGLNLIICHEPTFYTHEDQNDWLDGNKVYEAKKKLLDDTGIVIWRDHDHMHAGPGGKYDFPDYIFCGIMKTLGWDNYLVGSAKKPLLYEVPETTVRELTKEIAAKLNLNGARIIGDPDGKVKKVFICEHITGRDHDSKKIMLTDKEDYDVLIPLETIDWTILEYVTDSVCMGRSRAVISVGHFNFEGAGMKYMAQWLPEVIGCDVSVEYIQCGDIYSYIID